MSTEILLLFDERRERGVEATPSRLPPPTPHERPRGKAPVWRKILNKLRQNKEIFVTPHGSNDDWYWLYAALVAGEDAVLISNDEMRDHVFQMLPDPNLLRRWKERHQVRFSVTKGEVELYEPAVFTTCIQENEEEEYWMIPFVEDDDEEKKTTTTTTTRNGSFAARSNNNTAVEILIYHLRNKKLYPNNKLIIAKRRSKLYD